MRIALCGNPNVGKTTLFNRLTRSNAPTGNWHGVTVESKSKRAAHDKSIVFCDLPGAYSLTAFSREEEITRDEILFGGYDVYACVTEVNNLRRNLYFFTQLVEAKKRVILIVNMLDEARGSVDLDLLSKRLGVPVVGASERMANPRERIIAAAKTALRSEPIMPEYVKCFPVVKSDKLPQPFASVKAVERDEYVCGMCDGCSAIQRLDRDMPARLRYAYIDGALDGVIGSSGKSVYARVRKIDKILLGRLALPIFLAVMAAVFVITTEASKPLSALISRLVGRLAFEASKLPLPEWASKLLSEGIIGGAGAALCFLPQVSILFVLTALLQDCGYMSRVAFLSDGFFKRFGLSGRAAFSLVLGLGCSVTAVMSTRGISDKRAGRRAAFVSPFCPCGARLAVFVAITSQAGISGFAVAGLYILSFVVMLAVLAVMKRLGKRSSDDGFIMEMPPYRLPSAKRVVKSVATSVGDFLVRVGSIVLAVNVIVWLLSNFSMVGGFTGDPENSLMCTFSSLIAPIFAPLGFGNWRAATALVSGFAAKETIVAVISSLGGTAAVFGGKLAATSFLIFTCLYVPCVATLAALARENGVRDAALSVAVHTVTAYVAALIFYRSAALFTANLSAFIAVYASVAAVIAVVTVFFGVRKKHGKKVGV